MDTKTPGKQRLIKCRTLWLSDIHLGFNGCRADDLLDFLHSVECERIYLVGDIVDLWAMRKGLHWPQSHNNVVRTLLGLAKHGTRVVFVPGNHDELIRDFSGNRFGRIRIDNRPIHDTADGRRFLVTHGDEFDSVVQCSRLVAVAGSHAYEFLLKVNRIFNRIRSYFGRPYWSLSAYLKHKVKNAVNFISQYESILANEARKEGVDGVICGHIHRAEITDLDGITYVNCGDWVESCTAIIEDHNGKMELIHWLDMSQRVVALHAPKQAEQSRVRPAA
ncbi:MAG: UDP-2,3-diacylglucosamine diphosphatase [Gammaproteobacteria bacterium]|nr:UDP-2,3-diacylglucosamine diphosphatase [Gammaproteobacteria bacterium]